MGKYFTLSYDIPADAVMPGSPPLGTKGAKKYPNPSSKLRKYAFRFNKSCWVIPEDRRPNHLLAELMAVGGDVVDLPFDDAGSAKILALALKEMTRESLACQQTAEVAVANAEASYPGWVTRHGEAGAAKLYKASTYNALMAAQRVLKALEEAKAVFGVAPDLATPMGKIGSLMVVTKNKADQYIALAKAAAARAANVPTQANQALAAAAADDVIPAGPLHDALEDADALPAGVV